jgi:hypothetical protein
MTLSLPLFFAILTSWVGSTKRGAKRSFLVGYGIFQILVKFYYCFRVRLGLNSLIFLFVFSSLYVGMEICKLFLKKREIKKLGFWDSFLQIPKFALKEVLPLV